MHTYDKKIMTGFSLVEIMVGLTIGLITVLVIIQVMQVAETRKRSSTAGADSLVNAALGLYTIERDAKNAGYGLTTVNAAIGCPIRAKNGGTDINLDLAPVVITNGTTTIADAPDRIRFLASSKTGVTLPTRISVAHPANSATIFVESDLGMEETDLILAVPATIVTTGGTPNWCTLMEISSGVGGGGNGNNNNNGNGQGQNKVVHNSGQSPLNQPGGQNIMPTNGYAVGDYLFNLGDFSDHTYTITNNHLTLNDFNIRTNSTNQLALYPHIVQLQAVYGKDAIGSDGIVDTWNVTAPTTLAEWQQIHAVRMAIVARSQTLEANNVTLAGANCAPAPHPAAICWRPDPNADAVAINVNYDNANPNWQRYRYHVMETTIPLRNVIWQR